MRKMLRLLMMRNSFFIQVFHMGIRHLFMKMRRLRLRMWRERSTLISIYDQILIWVFRYLLKNTSRLPKIILRRWHRRKRKYQQRGQARCITTYPWHRRLLKIIGMLIKSTSWMSVQALMQIRRLHSRPCKPSNMTSSLGYMIWSCEHAFIYYRRSLTVEVGYADARRSGFYLPWWESISMMVSPTSAIWGQPRV